jgi:hypothetical protein
MKAMESQGPDITAENCMAYVLKQCRGFQELWLKHRRNYEGEETTVGIDMMPFITYAKTMIGSDNAEELAVIGNLVEVLVTSNDPDVSYAATMIFLEGITNSCSHDPESYPIERLIQHLKAESIEFCQELDRFWGTNTPGL